MPYSDFSLAQAIAQFSLVLYDRPHHFAPVPPIDPSDRLRELLQENVPLALASNTEKARSEWIIAPILVELRRQLAGRISLFSGIDVDIDPREISESGEGQDRSAGGRFVPLPQLRSNRWL